MNWIKRIGRSIRALWRGNNKVVCIWCGADDVISYERPTNAICPACCRVTIKRDGETTHQYEYERGERSFFCRYCGVPADEEWLNDRAAAMMEP